LCAGASTGQGSWSVSIWRSGLFSAYYEYFTSCVEMSRKEGRLPPVPLKGKGVRRPRFYEDRSDATFVTVFPEAAPYTYFQIALLAAGPLRAQPGLFWKREQSCL
jgi:hypothetical protein